MFQWRVGWQNQNAMCVANQQRALPSYALHVPFRCTHAVPCSTPKSSTHPTPTLSKCSQQPHRLPRTPPPSSAVSARSGGPGRSTAALCASTISTRCAPRPRSTDYKPTALGHLRSLACLLLQHVWLLKWSLSSLEDSLRALERVWEMCLCRTLLRETMVLLMLVQNHDTNDHYNRQWEVSNIFANFLS